MKPRSAVDCIGPAFDAAQTMMFRPYRWAKWWRFALIGMATAVIGTANGCNLGGVADFKEAFSRDPKAAELLAKLQAYVSAPQLAFFITVMVVGITMLTVVHIYVNSVARFMMFDAMTSGALRIRQGWTKWQGQGARLFGFQIAVSVFVTFVLSSMAYLFSAGARGGGTPGSVVAGFLALMGGMWLFSMVVVAVHVISVDFGVPVMAVEETGLVEALRRVWRMAAESPADYFLYLVMKVVLVIAVSLALLLVQIVVLVIPLMVMIVVMAMVVGTVIKSGSPVLIVATLSVMLTGFFSAVLFVVALFAAPTYVFFQAYTLEFFSDRYPRLKAVLHPAPAVLERPIEEPPPLPAM